MTVRSEIARLLAEVEQTREPAEVEQALLGYLCQRPKQVLPLWSVAAALCTSSTRSARRVERVFIVAQITRMVRERKIVMYYRRNKDRMKIRVRADQVKLWKSHQPGQSQP